MFYERILFFTDKKNILLGMVVVSRISLTSFRLKCTRGRLEAAQWDEITEIDVVVKGSSMRRRRYE